MVKFIYLTISLVLVLSCTINEQDTRKYIELDYPAHFPKPLLPARNPLTATGIALGERLFFDTSLSINDKVSCATCHNPEFSFSDGIALNTSGASGNKLKRNTPALINLAWMQGLFWDGGVHNLESLPFAALTNPDEMGSDLLIVSKKLNDDLSYKKMFKTAFDIDSISSAYIARALAQYQRTIIYSNSKYDDFIIGEIDLTKNEKLGMEIYQENCASCHLSPLFTDNGYHNNGLNSIYHTVGLDIMKGRFRITQDSLDLGKFKTPTLRNLKFTAPYMHDGRFATLEDVLNHYQIGIKASTTLDTSLESLSLSNAEKILLLRFLNTLNDKSLLTKNSN
jgi:cytochrome c peroxidase